MMRRHTVVGNPAAHTRLRFRIQRCRIQRYARRSDRSRQTPSVCAASGFTLMELLMVLSLLIVLTAISLPGLVRWQRALPLDQATSLLQQQLQETRLLAIQTGQPWRLVLPDSGRSGYREPVRSAASVAQQLASISRSTAAQNSFPQSLSAPRDVTGFQWPNGIRCEVLSPGDPDTQMGSGFVFHPDGTTSDQQLRLFNNYGHSQVLKLSRLTGQARIVRPRPHDQPAVPDGSVRSLSFITGFRGTS